MTAIARTRMSCDTVIFTFWQCFTRRSYSSCVRRIRIVMLRVCLPYSLFFGRPLSLRLSCLATQASFLLSRLIQITDSWQFALGKLPWPQKIWKSPDSSSIVGVYFRRTEIYVIVLGRIFLACLNASLNCDPYHRGLSVTCSSLSYVLVEQFACFGQPERLPFWTSPPQTGREAPQYDLT